MYLFIYSFIHLLTHHSMVMPSADPIQWREETERVSQRLKEKDTVVEKTGEWRGHLAMLRDYTNKGEINSKSLKSKITENRSEELV